jgi:hypothetical protein
MILVTIGNFNLGHELIFISVKWLYCKMLGSLDYFWPPDVQCLLTEDAVQIVNWFITIQITRNYIHSQFITLYHFYTAYNLTRL